MDTIYNKINGGLESLGVGARVDSLADLGVAAVALAFLTWMVTSLLFD